MEKQRDSNMELLRIVSIIMILYIHAFGLISGKGYTDFGCEITILANSICNMGVSCFILISGYYGIRFQWKKLFRMEIMVVLYSLLMTGLMISFFPDQMTDSALELLIKSCIPVTSRKYWFYSCYVCLMFISPFLNRAIERAGKKETGILLLSLLFLFSVLPTFLYFEITLDHGKGLINMITLYILGRWIRLYADVEIKRKNGLILFLVLLGINIFSHHYPIRVDGISHTLTGDNSITNIMMAVLLLYLFKNTRLRSGIINGIAANIFSVFILNTFVLGGVHRYVFRDSGKILTNMMPAWISLDVILTFVICVAVEGCRKLILGKPEKLLINVLDGCREKLTGVIRKTDWKKLLRIIWQV